MAEPGYNAPIEGIQFFAPRNLVSPGAAVDLNDDVPTLFTPLKIRGVTLKNRIIVAPMCQYSTAESGPNIGALTPYHIMTLGHYALKGAALVMIEGTGVQANGRITPNCAGLWRDEQIPGVRAVADAIHSQGALCGIQLAHAGRKASTLAPFVARESGMPSQRATKDVGGWPADVVGPCGGEEHVWDLKQSDDPTGEFYAPRELSIAEIAEVVRDWARAAQRAVKAGVDVIEIHAAHGYLFHQFLSPITNRRTDRYGGSFEGRIRIVVEAIEAVRAVIPESMPVFLRISATEWMEEATIGQELGSWDLESSIKLAKVVAELGVDLLDVSSGGNHPRQRLHMFISKDYQTKMASRIRAEVKREGKKLLIGAVGNITEAEQARDIIQDGEIGHEAEAAKEMTDAKGGKEPMADLILVARQLLREPGWVLNVASKLGINVSWPLQFFWVKP